MRRSAAGWGCTVTDRMKFTGKLEWVGNHAGCTLHEKVEIATRNGEPIEADYPTSWWIFRPNPFFPYRVCKLTDQGIAFTKHFWRLEKAKSYAEVMHRMGVHE